MLHILLLGISGLDSDLLRVYGPSLPNLRCLMLESPFVELASTIPPEPLPAWTSVYTGLNPARHGMLAKMDCLERVTPEAHSLQEHFFWEKAARAGKRVCVLNPLLAGNSSTGKLLLVRSTPLLADDGARPVDAFPALLDEPLMPAPNALSAFCDSLQERTQQQVAVALDLYKREPWDLFFVQLDALDTLQHFLWRYSDPGDPTYPGRNEHMNRILDFYRLFDDIVGHFRAIMREKCLLGVVSSHGHERRCIYRLHLNEWLREQHLLTPLNPPRSLFDSSTVAHTRRTQSRWRTYDQREAFSAWLAHYLPWNDRRSGARQCIDQHKTVAQLVELASTTSSYGGIHLQREVLEREQLGYEQVCETILSGLAELRINESLVVNWARRREQCYQGTYLHLYPDILFELRSDLGVGGKLYTPLLLPDATHRLISGAHNAHGVFLLANWPQQLTAYEDLQHPSVMDVAPTLLRLLNVEYPALDGQALVSARPLRQLI